MQLRNIKIDTDGSSGRVWKRRELWWKLEKINYTILEEDVPTCKTGSFAEHLRI